MKEKRRRVVHLLKEGLEVSYDGLSKKPETDEIHLEHADEVEENEIQIQPIRSEEVLNTTSVSLESSQEPVHGNEVETYKYVSEHPTDISIDNHLDEIRSSPMSCSIDEIKGTKSKVLFLLRLQVSMYNQGTRYNSTVSFGPLEEYPHIYNTYALVLIFVTFFFLYVKITDAFKVCFLFC